MYHDNYRRTRQGDSTYRRRQRRPAIRPIEASKAAICYVRNAEGFRTPALCGRAGLGAGPASESLVRRKPRGGWGAAWLGATYGDLKVADGSPVWRRRPEAAGAIGGNEDDALFRGRRCGRRVWARRLERVCGGRVDIAFLLRRAAGGEAKRRCVTGSAATVMRCRS